MNGIHKTYDIAIIGGGINGVALAAEAQSSGLKVILIEKEDLASGTSSASSKLIHGGLRYLEQGAFNLVRESLVEQSILLHRAPHLVHPVKFFMPLVPAYRQAWKLRLGLWFYDHIAKRHAALAPSGKGYLLADPWLHPRYLQGYHYSDCLTDDTRLVIENALLAQSYGAAILTRTNWQVLRRQPDHWSLQLTDRHQRTSEITVRMVINASGTAVQSVQKILTGQDDLMSLSYSQGSHIIFKQRQPLHQAYLLQQADKRVVFVIPWQGYTLIGTTDTTIANLQTGPQITSEETAYLCQAVNMYGQNLMHQDDIVWHFSGVRVLVHHQKHQHSANTNSLASVNREAHFSVSHESSLAPLVTIYGGKLTTHRALAEKVIKQLKPIFPQLLPSRTAKLIFPGAYSDAKTLNHFQTQTRQQYAWLPVTVLERYLKNYGVRVSALLENCRGLSDMGQHYGHGLYQRELEFLQQKEWAVTFADVLWRRTQLGLQFIKNATRLEGMLL